MSPSDPPSSSSSGTPLLSCSSLPPVQSTFPAAAVPPLPLHLLLGRPPRVTLPLSRSYFPSPLSSFARATTTRASAGRHLAAAVFRARACSISLPLLLSNTSSSYLIHFHLFSPCRVHPEAPIGSAARSSLPVNYEPPWTAATNRPLLPPIL
jgi:hypothetical protein